MPLYCAAVLEEIQKPDVAIVHVGTNDIRGREIAEIREDFVNLHTYMQEQDINMIISQLRPRALFTCVYPARRPGSILMLVAKNVTCLPKC